MPDSLEFRLRKVGSNLTLEHKPVPTTRPHPSKRVLVIGGGVTGLTTAWALLDAGFGVVVLSDQWAPASPRIVSQVAGALYVPFACFLGMIADIHVDGSGHPQFVEPIRIAYRSPSQKDGA